MKKLTEEAKRELLDAARSDSLKRDMQALKKGCHNPFIKNGKVDIDAYVRFVCEYNEFINHKRKPFKPMLIREMKL